MTHPTPQPPRSAAAPDGTRTDAAVAWIVWHIGELVAVGVPLVLALAVSWWFVLLAVLLGAAWTVREIRTTTRPALASSAGAATSPAALAPADQAADHLDTRSTDRNGSTTPAGNADGDTQKGATA